MITYKDWTDKHYILQVKKIIPFNVKKPFTPFEGFGIECGKGWDNILDKLCTKIESYLDKNPKNKKHFSISQIKEKNGGLRFYINGGSDEIYKYISEAENESYKTCEVCGKLGECNKKGWLSTLCKKCREENEKRFK